MSCGPFCLSILHFFGLPRGWGGTNPRRGHFTARCNWKATQLVTDSPKPLFMRGFKHNCLLGHWSASKQCSRWDFVSVNKLHSHVNRHKHSLLKSNYYNGRVMSTVCITILKVILSKAVRFHSHCLHTCQQLLNVSETSHLLLSTIFIFTPSDVATMWDNVKPCCWGCKFHMIFLLNTF